LRLTLVFTGHVARSLALNFGVYPVIVAFYNNTDEIVEDSRRRAKEMLNLKDKDIIIITGGFPNNDRVKSTNFLKIEEI